MIYFSEEVKLIGISMTKVWIRTRSPFDEKSCNDFVIGNFRSAHLVRKSGGLKEIAVSNEEGSEKRFFFNFISRMLQWRPEDRSSVDELLSDPWLGN